MKKYIVLAISIISLPIQVSTYNNNKLTWDNFKGTPRYDSQYDAELYCQIDYVYRYLDGIIHVNASCIVLSKSWVKPGKETPELLNHEQGHYDIWYYYVKKFEITASKISAPASQIDLAVKKVFDTIFNECYTVQNKYEIETNHGRDRSAQKKWDTYIDSLLNGTI